MTLEDIRKDTEYDNYICQYITLDGEEDYIRLSKEQILNYKWAQFYFNGGYKEIMRVKIDNYEISATKDVEGDCYFRVIIDDENIIGTKLNREFSRKNLIAEAIMRIEIYNEIYNLEWGKSRE